MPFDWRHLIPYGLGRLIPKPQAETPTIMAPAPSWLGDPSNPSAGMSAIGSSITPTTFTPTPAAPAAPTPAPAAPNVNPLAVAAPTSVNPLATNPGVTPSGGIFSPGGIFGDAPGGGRPNTGGYGGQFGGVAPWSAQGVAASASAQNPGSTGTASVDLGPAPNVAHLNNYAQ